ncbi:hypothetical protein P692DRAFT_20882121 [Suillus brevipes Sb2]|nr:hypothetical protein P692DRAFT_20882121 [Suillus brevipes Sb2]
MHRSSQAENLQLKRPADELSRSHAKELDDHRRIANLRIEEVEKLSAARTEIQDLHSKEVEFTKRRVEQDENYQKTISLLVSEKTSLLASIARLEELEMEIQEKGELLQAERDKSQSLEESVKTELNIQLQEAVIRERDLAEKLRDQDRELQLPNASLEEAKSASEQEKDKVSVQQSIIELGYAELQAELVSESSQAAVLSLEGDRTQLRQIEARQLEIINRLSMESDQHSQVQMQGKSPSYLIPADGHACSAGDSEYLASSSDIKLRGASTSFISIPSSNNLTTHPRANTSYDPALDTVQRGVTVARFYALKLNRCPHTPNSKLQEENKAPFFRVPVNHHVSRGHKFPRSAKHEPEHRLVTGDWNHYLGYHRHLLLYRLDPSGASGPELRF